MATTSASGCDDETRALQALFEAFSTVCPLEEIALAYCKAGNDACKAGEILYLQQESSICGLSDRKNGKFPQSGGLLDEDEFKSSTHLGKSSKGTKPKKLTATVGSISSVLGKKYVHRVSSSRTRSGSNETTKPPKLEIKELSADTHEFESFVPKSSIQTNDCLNDKDVEEFLFSMLGDGFKLSRDMIPDVLGRCGYDLKKSMEELLVLSAKTLNNGKAVDYGDTETSTGEGSKMENCFFKGTLANSSSSLSDIPEHPSTEQKNSDLPREVLQSLFSVRERSEEPKKNRLEIGLNRTRVVGRQPVTKSWDDLDFPSTIELPNTIFHLRDGLVAEEDDEYHILRRAAKQNWDLMKQYYEAAVDDFTKGEKEKAKHHLEQGKYFNQKAREADEKAAAMLIEPRKGNKEDEITIDLQAHHSKEALDLVKFLLRSLANIPTFRHLKLIIGADGEDSKKGKRRRLVLKLLDNESIKWCEDEHNQGTICVQLDQVNPNKLSFAKE
ncbi:nuclear RNA export factor SDE5 isoform X3 [Canna indica]|uniref:Nuclear RNA export factor SDE5 isoform X3 n=1 Tax=Canna indica TaxID=4628 RepID=A0AAQ3KKA4_9LILI|nr:nuclear RNA export factor SDE5 isoform X3 [Canna indica]